MFEKMLAYMDEHLWACVLFFVIIVAVAFGLLWWTGGQDPWFYSQ